jgi:uncharacterized protein
MPVRELSRLSDLLASDAGEVAYQVQGTRDERGRPSLLVKARGGLQLRCQRCLEAMPFEIATEQTLVLAQTQEEIDADPVDPSLPDRVLASKEMPVRELIEDELILALPYAPRHAQCAARTDSNTGKATSPFAGLRGLLGDKH